LDHAFFARVINRDVDENEDFPTSMEFFEFLCLDEEAPNKEILACWMVHKESYTSKLGEIDESKMLSNAEGMLLVTRKKRAKRKGANMRT
jgi:hypothetical protein